MSSDIQSLKEMVLRYASVDTTPTQKNKKEIVEDDQGRKGFWTTSKGRHIFIPVNGATQSNKSVTVKGKDIPDDKRFKTTEKEEEQERGMSVESKPAKTAELRWKIQKKPKEKLKPKPEEKQDLSQYQRPMTEFDSYVARRVANNCYHGIADAMEKYVESGMNKELSRKASRNLGALAARVYRLHGGREALNTFARGLGVSLEHIQDDQKALNHLISTVRMNIENNHSRSKGLKRRYESNLQMFDNLQAKLEGRTQNGGIAQPVADSQTEQEQPKEKEKEDERIEQEEREEVRGRSDSDTGTLGAVQKTLFDMAEVQKEESKDKPVRRNEPSDGGRERRRADTLDESVRKRLKKIPILKLPKEQEELFSALNEITGGMTRSEEEKQKLSEISQQLNTMITQERRDIVSQKRDADTIPFESEPSSLDNVGKEVDSYMDELKAIFESAEKPPQDKKYLLKGDNYGGYVLARLAEMSGEKGAVDKFRNELIEQHRERTEKFLSKNRQKKSEEAIFDQAAESVIARKDVSRRERKQNERILPNAYSHVDTLKLSPAVKEAFKRRIDKAMNIAMTSFREAKDPEFGKHLSASAKKEARWDTQDRLRTLENTVRTMKEDDVKANIYLAGTSPDILKTAIPEQTRKVKVKTPKEKKAEPKQDEPKQNAEIKDWFKRLDSIVSKNPDDKKIKSLAKEAEAFRTTDISVEDLREMLPGKKKLLEKLNLKKSGTVEAIA